MPIFSETLRGFCQFSIVLNSCVKLPMRAKICASYFLKIGNIKIMLKLTLGGSTQLGKVRPEFEELLRHILVLLKLILGFGKTDESSLQFL